MLRNRAAVSFLKHFEIAASPKASIFEAADHRKKVHAHRRSARGDMRRLF